MYWLRGIGTGLGIGGTGRDVLGRGIPCIKLLGGLCGSRNNFGPTKGGRDSKGMYVMHLLKLFQIQECRLRPQD